MACVARGSSILALNIVIAVQAGLRVVTMTLYRIFFLGNDAQTAAGLCRDVSNL